MEAAAAHVRKVFIVLSESREPRARTKKKREPVARDVADKYMCCIQIHKSSQFVRSPPTRTDLLSVSALLSLQSPEKCSAAFTE